MQAILGHLKGFIDCGGMSKNGLELEILAFDVLVLDKRFTHICSFDRAVERRRMLRYPDIRKRTFISRYGQIEDRRYRTII